MKRVSSVVIAVVAAVLTAAPVLAGGDAFKQSALSWKKQASDTRAAVVGVAEEIEKIGYKGNRDAEDLMRDAKEQLGKGDDSFKKGEKAMKAGDYEKAAAAYNMAWQYYVKAATAGLNAKRVLTGQ